MQFHSSGFCDLGQVLCASSIYSIEVSNLFPKLLLICLQCLYVEGRWNTWDSRVTLAKLQVSLTVSYYKLTISSKLDYFFIFV